MAEFYTNDPDGDRKRIMEALDRSSAEMKLWLHEQMIFDAGMSYYCLVCGARQQSLQPTPTFEHRSTCPLFEIGRTLPLLIRAVNEKIGDYDD